MTRKREASRTSAEAKTPGKQHTPAEAIEEAKSAERAALAEARRLGDDWSLAHGIKPKDDLPLALRQFARSDHRIHLLIDAAQRILHKRTGAQVWKIAVHASELAERVHLKWVQQASLARDGESKADVIIVGRPASAFYAAISEPHGAGRARRPLLATDRELLAALGLLNLLAALGTPTGDSGKLLAPANPGDRDALLDAAECIHKACGHTIRPVRATEIWRVVLESHWADITPIATGNNFVHKVMARLLQVGGPRVFGASDPRYPATMKDRRRLAFIADSGETKTVTTKTVTNAVHELRQRQHP
jgi:hypothetical protein